MNLGRIIHGATLGAAITLASGLPIAVQGATPPVQMPAPATPIGERQALLADLDVPIGPWRAGAVKTVAVEGQLSQTAWRLDDSNLSTLDLMKVLRAQLVARGYEVVYECRTRSCGGFDFRFNVDVLPEPEMHVDLGDFRFLSARRVRGDDGAASPGEKDADDYVTLMVSRSFDTGFVQVTQVSAPDSGATAAVLSTRSAPGGMQARMPGSAVPGATYEAAMPGVTGSLAAELEKGGAIALDDLTFEVGSTRLGPGPFVSLKLLADYLLANPDSRVTLVGHSDALGGLEQNIVLSRQRAEAVMAVLARDHGVPKAQIEAAGVGYLAPRASNLTADGRDLNRRVEVVLTSSK